MAELILSLKDRELSRHALGPETRIGRDPGNQVLIDNMGVSRHHATVLFDGTSVSVRDEASQNGVFVNGTRISTQALRDGDVVQLGKFSLKLNLAGNGSTPPSSQALHSLPPRDMARTLALAPLEVQQLVAAQQAARSASTSQTEPEEEEEDSSWKVLIIGLLAITALAIVAYFLLIHR